MKANKQRHIPTLGSRVTSLVSVSLVLFLLGIMALSGILARTLNDQLRHNLGFIVRMEQGASPESIYTVKQALIASPAVGTLSFVSAEDIYAQEQTLMGEDFALLLDANPYSAEFDIKVRPDYAFSDSIAIISGAFSRLPQVEEVISESTVIEGIDRTLRRVGIITAVVTIILALVSIALIRNAVYLSVYSRRFIIHTMKLVGATGAFIRRPFVRASLLNGFIAGIIATILVVALVYYATSFDVIFIPLLSPLCITSIAVFLMIVGMIICGLTAMAATNKYLRSTYDEMFLK